jgi:hypothetical protein
MYVWHHCQQIQLAVRVEPNCPAGRSRGPGDIALSPGFDAVSAGLLVDGGRSRGDHKYVSVNIPGFRISHVNGYSICNDIVRASTISQNVFKEKLHQFRVVHIILAQAVNRIHAQYVHEYAYAGQLACS